MLLPCQDFYDSLFGQSFFLPPYNNIKKTRFKVQYKVINEDSVIFFVKVFIRRKNMIILTRDISRSAAGHKFLCGRRLEKKIDPSRITRHIREYTMCPKRSDFNFVMVNSCLQIYLQTIFI